MGVKPFDDSLAVSTMGGRGSSELLPPILDRLETWSKDGSILPGIEHKQVPPATPPAVRSSSSHRVWSEPCFSVMSSTARLNFSATTGR